MRAGVVGGRGANRRGTLADLQTQSIHGVQIKLRPNTKIPAVCKACIVDFVALLNSYRAELKATSVYSLVLTY